MITSLSALRARLRGRALPLPASDPGLLRLMAGLRTVVSIGLTLLVLVLLGAPVMVQVAGALTALISTVAVSETLLKDQAVTLAFGLPVACAAVAAGTLLAPYRVVADIVFVLVIFAAVYVRRYGQRGKALGMISFQLFFVAQFVHVGAAKLPMLVGVVAVAFGCGALVRFGLLRVTPEQTLSLLMGSFRTRLRQAVGLMVELAGQGRDGAGRERTEKRLRRRIERLHECALMIQGRLEDSTPDARTATSVQRRVAGMEIATERLAAVLLDPDRPPHTPGLTGRLRELYEAVGRDWLQRRTPVGLGYVRDRLLGYRENAGLEGVPAADQEALRAAGELAFSVLGLRVALGTAGSETDEDSPKTRQYREELETEELSLRAEAEPLAMDLADLEGEPGEKAQKEKEEDAEPRGLQRPSTRIAFQVTVGSALAIVSGELLSSQRWYWAVLTCWVVFLGTSSTGEILVKGYRRLAGTVIGVIAGVGLTGLVAGNSGLAFVLVLVFVFAMFYTAPVSYTLMSFFTTAMLGLLFTVLHTYSDEILILRIEETAIGAACGLGAALLVLPVRTSEHTDEQLRTVLERMRDVVEEAVRRLSGDRADGAGGAAGAGGGAGAVDLLDSARELDDALDDLRSAVQPLTHPVSPLRSRSQKARYVVALLDTAAYHVRGLAAVAEQLTGNSRIAPDPRVASAAGRLSRNLRSLTRHLEEPEEEPDSGLLPASDTIGIAVIDHPSRSPVGSRVARHIQRLDEIVIGLAEPLEMPVEGGRKGRKGKQSPPSG
ncbi:FUSC family protein [Streptomyces lycii]|uniref:FUSC family protein n=1 Tax=Streptomyces lycii TaxID=2654337 RepID=A0ABQ7FLB8_9ACTN|nr:FUSC family protein [Streptomyces lycii]KAF4409756.1 FUSC family protein [Streptomyces lycii]